MQVIDKKHIDNALDFDSLITAMQQGFALDFTMPKRNVYELDSNSGSRDAFAVLPAWNEQVIGVKAFTYFPNNGEAGFDSLYSKIMLFSREHGEPLALVDGTSITLWRTASVSALASRYLSRENSNHLVFFGSGNLAEYMVRAHLAVRNFKRVTLVARNHLKVVALQSCLEQLYPDVEFVIGQSTQEVIYSADVISCATGSQVPLFDGNWLKSGTHVDLIGNHQSDHRECDTATITRSRVYVDSKTNVLGEAGELLIPISEGVFCEQSVCAELADLAKVNTVARFNETDITVFKSVGTALSDLIAANQVYQSLQN
ncbi:ornithine cyclodeaminase family protein [Pseudoalteromonas sp. SR44-5]|uniref:ornithine cyclodeaminase family protein n=1 Tax=unclassified Pseudoalteromonas TaxID=194690 RepID=UPI00160036CC|nr:MULTISPECIES: ornithine cyclodeaminase family protein [unclassified Pseudoalteromonas]MBB1291425.1 ornithine cyclodeaminase family protein [Pseudoalteromonas sp. SR41-4]MBB1331977.1 ornithine cyclodeaminase family protein [Pseudoalteromonas sp. SR41-6]MBB1340796.1 ornithine cyclodeaminase family protein [Pseudoalteromonas sp. SR45-6]MBB1365774.1 ornithine cyclodeaminase family protein [Pseudoalteromonas sp. SR44-5]MBB1416765.1 ornithine cyclodeaminase family protein [Pseudoalteromonas sp. S